MSRTIKLLVAEIIHGIFFRFKNAMLLTKLSVNFIKLNIVNSNDICHYNQLSNK